MARRLALLAGLLVLAPCGSDESPAEPPRAASVEVHIDDPRFDALGLQRRVEAVVRDEAGRTQPSARVDWASDNPGVVTIDEEGYARAVGNGAARVTATVGTASDTVVLTVEQLTTRVEVTLSTDELRAVGVRAVASARAYDRLESVVTSARFRWSSSDTSVALVDQEGGIRSMDTGEALIRAEAREVVGSAPLVVTQLLQPEDVFGTVAFVGVHVVPMTFDGVLADQTVVVEGETIVAVGARASVSVPPDAHVVDGTGEGWYLMPGLADLHTHLGTNYAEFTNQEPPATELQTMAEGQMLLYLAHGVTTILSLGDFVEPVLRWRGEVLDGRYPGPTIYSGRWLRGPGGTADGGPPWDAPNTPDGARALVRETEAEGHHFLKLYNWPSAPVVRAAMDEADGVGLGVIGHIPQTLSPGEVWDRGMDGAAHAEAFLWTLFGFTPDDSRIPEAVDMVARADGAVITTLGLVRTKESIWGGNQAGIARFWERPEVRFMHWTEVGLHEEGLNGTRWNPPGAVPGGYGPIYAFVKRYTRALHDAGIPLLAGTDSPTVLGVAGASMLEELDVLGELGLSNFEILAAATRNGAEFIGRHLPGEQPFGAVEVGRRADLLLIDANPLDDVAHAGDRVGIMARGRWRSESFLLPLLDVLTESYGN